MAGRRITSSESGQEPHYRVRVVLPNALLFFASRTEPKVRMSAHPNVIAEVVAEWIEHPDYGDSIGYVQWGQVSAVTWRYSE